MCQLENGIWCIDSNFQEAKGASSATQAVRKLVSGVFRTEAIIKSTKSGRPGKAGKSNKSYQFKPDAVHTIYGKTKFVHFYLT